MNRVFISGPMQNNRPAFDTEAARLRCLAAENEFAMLMLSIAVRLRVGLPAVDSQSVGGVAG